MRAQPPATKIISVSSDVKTYLWLIRLRGTLPPPNEFGGIRGFEVGR